MPSLIQIVLRRDTSSNWSAENPLLVLGEPALETDTNKLKFGNGNDNYNDLDYFCDTKEIQRTAGENITQGRAVILINSLVYHFDNTKTSHYGLVVGISKNNVLITETSTIIIEGVVNGLSGMIINKEIYAITTGLTDTAPTNAISQKIGVSLAVDLLLLKINNPIIKA